IFFALFVSFSYVLLLYLYTFPTRRSSDLIPFYQIVYHGLVDYAGQPINLSSSPSEDMLKCLEYGAVPYYRFIYQPSSAMKETVRSEEHTSELQSRFDLVCRLLLEKKYYIT